MKHTAKFLIPLMLFLMLLTPALSLAEPVIVSPIGNNVLVPCRNTPVLGDDGKVKLDTNGKVQYDSKCDFDALMTLVMNFINFVLYYMVIPIAAIMFAYAGFLLVTAGGEAAGARTKAKSIFTNALIGLVLAVACWLIVSTILAIVGYKDAALFGLHISL